MQLETEPTITENKDKSNNNKWEFTLRGIIGAIVFTSAFIGQFILLFFFNNELDLDFLKYLGWFLWGLSAILGPIPIIYLKRKGGVKKGESYINTSKLVTNGLYAIIRHPQYLSFILIVIGFSLITQSWISLILTILVTVMTYVFSFQEEKKLIEKFGEDYITYQKEVPRFYLLLGLIKYFIRTAKK